MSPLEPDVLRSDVAVQGAARALFLAVPSFPETLYRSPYDASAISDLGDRRREADDLEADGGWDDDLVQL